MPRTTLHTLVRAGDQLTPGGRRPRRGGSRLRFSACGPAAAARRVAATRRGSGHRPCPSCGGGFQRSASPWLGFTTVTFVPSLTGATHTPRRFGCLPRSLRPSHPAEIASTEASKATGGRRHGGRPKLLSLAVRDKQVTRHATQIEVTIVHGRPPSRWGSDAKTRKPRVSILTAEARCRPLHSFSSSLVWFLAAGVSRLAQDWPSAWCPELRCFALISQPAFLQLSAQLGNPRAAQLELSRHIACRFAPGQALGNAAVSARQ